MSSKINSSQEKPTDKLNDKFTDADAKVATRGLTTQTFSKLLKNNVTTLAVILALGAVMFGLGQVLVRNLAGDRAVALNTSSYLSQVGFTSVEPTSGAFAESKKICESGSNLCQADGIVDYTFSNLADSFGVKPVEGGGLILNKKDGVFEQNGMITSGNYVPDSGKTVKISKIQVGIGLKQGNLFSFGYSIDSGQNFTTAVGNFSFEQLQSQANQTVVEYNFTTPVEVTSGFAYKIALKADSSLKKSPSLKYVRVFYTVSDKTSSGESGGQNASQGGSGNSGTSTANPGGNDTANSGSGTNSGSSGSNNTTQDPAAGSGTPFLPVPSGGGENTPQSSN